MFSIPSGNFIDTVFVVVRVTSTILSKLIRSISTVSSTVQQVFVFPMSRLVHSTVCTLCSLYSTVHRLGISTEQCKLQMKVL